MRSTLTGDASPPFIRRTVALPENAPPSYWPDCRSETPFAESSWSLVVTLQPVFVSNGVTQSKAGSVWPRSA